MKKLSFISTVFFMFFLFIVDKEVLSWEPTKNHADFSRYAAENSVLSKDKGDYLKKNLGFEKELLEEFKLNESKRTVKDWLAKGSEAEDYAKNNWEIILGDARFNNHFHNPIRTWYDSNPDNLDAGLDDWFVFHYTGLSSLLWAQDGAYQQGFHEGDWSWKTISNSLVPIFQWLLRNQLELLYSVA